MRRKVLIFSLIPFLVFISCKQREKKGDHSHKEVQATKSIEFEEFESDTLYIIGKEVNREFNSNLLKSKNLKIDESTILTELSGQWYMHPNYRGAPFKLFNFRGDFIDYGDGWLIVGLYDQCWNDKCGHNRQWNIEYDGTNDKLTWTYQDGNRTKVFNRVSNSRIVNLRKDTNGKPIAIVLRETVPNFLSKGSYLVIR